MRQAVRFSPAEALKDTQTQPSAVAEAVASTEVSPPVTVTVMSLAPDVRPLSVIEVSVPEDDDEDEADAGDPRRRSVFSRYHLRASYPVAPNPTGERQV